MKNLCQHPRFRSVHSTGGVGDKTSFLAAPIVAVDGLYVPMISWPCPGPHRRNPLKLESIPG
jgi:hypothetical protein